MKTIKACRVSHNINVKLKTIKAYRVSHRVSVKFSVRTRVKASFRKMKTINRNLEDVDDKK